jgi:ferric-dicitrate binding protein FerR (iron transport regulator)
MSARRDRGSELRVLRRGAARWVLQLEAGESDRGEACSDEVSRVETFLVWLEKSPEHVRAFFESYETDRRLRAVASAGWK